MVIPLTRRASNGRQVRGGLRDGCERERVARVEHRERPVCPVDLDGKVVPRGGDEGGFEEHVPRVVADFEEVRVRRRELACGVRERRT